MTILEGPISEHEVEVAIKSLKKRKSPGSDGLPSELYLKFPILFKNVLSKVFNECFIEGKLCDSMYNGIITLIYKGKGDRSIRSNWRPITLLNTDYKILTKILYNRLKVFTPKLVHKNQTCSIPGRNIQDGIFSLYSVIKHSIESNENGIILSIDQKSAFDIIEWEFLRNSLIHFRIPENYRKWFDIIYQENKVNSAIIMNGYLSKSIDISRGVRQGCPLSPILYILASEVFCNKIRMNPEIRGFTLDGENLKLSNYADDTNFLVKDYESVSRIFKEYEKFNKSSGAVLNLEKTQILEIGDRDIPKPQTYDKYVVENLRIYGIVFNKTGFDHDLSFQGPEKSIQKLLEINPHSEFSYESRANFMNTYFLSKFWYVSHFITPSEKLQNLTNKAVTKFLWYPSRKPKIKGAIVYQSRRNGGIGIQNIDLRIKTLRLMFLLRSFKSENLNWSNYFKTRLSNLKATKNKFTDQFYSEIASVEQTTGFKLNGHKVFMFGKEYVLSEINSKFIYELLCGFKFHRHVDCFKTRWQNLLQNQDINFLECFSNNFQSGLDGYAKDIHYCFINNALQTNDKISKWKANVSPNCKFCLKSGFTIKETNLHALVECPRLSEFWIKLQNFFSVFGLRLDRINKIFGFLEKHTFRDVSNILVQIAQKTIWVSRSVFDNNDIAVDVWKSFKRKSKNLLAQRNKMYMTSKNKEILSILHSENFS
jgi:hypothetical protein